MNAVERLFMFNDDGIGLDDDGRIGTASVPKGTVSARMTRGRQKLKTWMEEER